MRWPNPPPWPLGLSTSSSVVFKNIINFDFKQMSIELGLLNEPSHL